MFESNQYRLVDFGNGKKLEEFSGVRVLRDCPAAEFAKPKTKSLSLISTGTVAFYKRSKSWQGSQHVPDPWIIQHFRKTFHLKPTPFGHLGVFPEQAGNWKWIQDLPFDLNGMKALNLFAYTGGTTMALAIRGAEVTHVDSAKNVVRWASDNARATCAPKSNIRWIVEDAQKFVNRQTKRGNFYDIIVADPPAIGHAGKKMSWKFDRDIGELLKALVSVANENLAALLITCHSQNHDAMFLERNANDLFSLERGNGQSGTMDLVTEDGRKLNCGHFFRWNCSNRK